jgi:hypothetical protein
MLEGRWINSFSGESVVFKTEQSSRHNGCTGTLSLRDLVLSVRLQLAMIRRRLCMTRSLGLKRSHFLLSQLDRRRCGVGPFQCLNAFMCGAHLKDEQ